MKTSYVKRIGLKPAIVMLMLIAATVVVASCAPKAAAISGATAWDAGINGEVIAVDALNITRGSLVNTVSSSGVVAGVNEAVAVAETQGIVKRVAFSIGDRVTAGAELLRVDDSIAALNLQRAKDQLDSANLELKANEQLTASGGSSPAALTRARSAASAANAQYETALKAFNDTVVRSPISGLIASREETATVGNIISPFTRIARIVDNSSFRITVGVGEREVGLIESGAVAMVSIPAALGETEVRGTVTAVGAGADSATGSFPVVVSFRNEWGNLVKSGMSASVSVSARESRPVIVVPASALVRRGNRFAVFVEKGGLAQARELTLGRKIGVRVEVLSGLEAGEKLIISALGRLQSGTPVALTNRGDSATYE